MIATGERLATLDGLRGLAVMGILLMNIAAFALPAAAYFNPLAYGAAGPAELALWATEFVLVDGKMRALFSLLFGASLLLVLERARARGEDADRAHFQRMKWLLLFGLIHFYLIWHGDILTLYAVTGCIAWWFSEMTVRQLIRWALALLALQFLIYASVTPLALDVAPGGSGWRELQSAFGIPDPDDIAREAAIYRGGYTAIFLHRLKDMGWVPVAQAAMLSAETLALMLLGMAALRSGFLTGAWPRQSYVRAAALGYGIGVPLSGALAWTCWRSGFDARMMFAAAFPLGLPARPFMLLGHMALAILWLTARESRLRDRVAAAGRAAFTNYLGSSLLMTGLFYGFGFGLFGRLDRFALLGIVVGAWGIMLLWSEPWLARFAFGPLEWLWRSLARRKMQPMLKQDIARHSH